MQARLKTPKTMEAVAVLANDDEHPVELERVDRERDVGLGDVAYCQECDTFLQGNQYWSLPKTVGLHRKGRGCRRVGFYRPHTTEQEIQG